MACWTSCSAMSRLEREIELQGDDRGARGARGGHLGEARNLAELHLERRGHGGRHHLGARAGVEGLHLDGRIVDVRERGDRQELAPPPGPTSTSAIISSDVATGRSTNRREKFMARASEGCRQLAAPAPCAPRARAEFLRLDPGGAPGVEASAAGAAACGRRATLILAPSLRRSVPSITTVSPDGQAGQNRGVLTVARTRESPCGRTRVSLALTEIDVIAGRAAQHRRRRHEHRLIQGVDQDLDVDELVRETAPRRRWRNWRAESRCRCWSPSDC